MGCPPVPIIKLEPCIARTYKACVPVGRLPGKCGSRWTAWWRRAPRTTRWTRRWRRCGWPQMCTRSGCWSGPRCAWPSCTSRRISAQTIWAPATPRPTSALRPSAPWSWSTGSRAAARWRSTCKRRTCGQLDGVKGEQSTAVTVVVVTWLWWP